MERASANGGERATETIAVSDAFSIQSELQGSRKSSGFNSRLRVQESSALLRHVFNLSLNPSALAKSLSHSQDLFY